MTALIRFWYQPRLLELSGVDEAFVHQLAACELLPPFDTIEEAAAYLRRMHRIHRLYETPWEALEIIERLRNEVIEWQQRYYELKAEHEKLRNAYERLWDFWQRHV